MCDPDIDADNVLNNVDNCPYYPNTDQKDVDGNDVGDVCETDADHDGVGDNNDTCPFNKKLSVTSFKDYFTVNLDPSLTTTAPKWFVKNNGGEVMQTEYTGMPTMLIGINSHFVVLYHLVN